MNPSTAQARVLVDALIGFGVRDAVVAPGSRSAPLALALAEAAARDEVTLHVRIDERSAGFLALGLAKASGMPVPVVVTSGTAVANLHPAVIEASYAGVPLMVLSADRPGALRGVGAPQTIDQIKIFGDEVRLFVEVSQAQDRPGEVAYWRSLAARAAAVATEPSDPGPVHLNIPFAEPLLPDVEGGVEFRESLAGREGDVSWISPFSVSPSDVSLTAVLAGMGFEEIPERTLVVVGDIPDVGWDGGRKAAYLADRCGWPIVAEPSATMHRARTWLPAGPAVVASEAWIERHRPDLVISIGKVGLTRQVSRLLGRAGAHLAIDPTPRWSDPGRTASAVLIGSVPMPPRRLVENDGVRVVVQDSGWLTDWQQASSVAGQTIDQMLDDEWDFFGLHVARRLWQRLPDNALLFLGSSWPTRQVYYTNRPHGGLRVMGNRGTNGIDGVVSSAWGAAVAHAQDISGPTYALMGDLTFLHDSNGLLAPREEPRPQLTYVVVDNDGGGIFSQLEQGRPEYAEHFERVFGTPHGLNLTGMSRLRGIPARQVDDLAEFDDALNQRPPGVSVLVANVASRADEAALWTRLQEAVDQALA